MKEKVKKKKEEERESCSAVRVAHAARRFQGVSFLFCISGVASFVSPSSLFFSFYRTRHCRLLFTTITSPLERLSLTLPLTETPKGNYQ